MSYVVYRMSYVVYRMSYVVYRMLYVVYRMLYVVHRPSYVVNLMPDAQNPNPDSPIAESSALDELIQWRNKVALAFKAASQAKNAVESEIVEAQNLKSMIGSGMDIETLRVFGENERIAQDKLSEFAGLKAGLARINAGLAALGIKKE